MKKFVVFSGFLGSGKTTAMMALTKYFTRNHGAAAMISNDLGDQSLADNRLAQLSGCNASELTGDCICYQRENLAARLDSLYSEGCSLVISDIPGFGVGALDHVYHGLEQDYPGHYELGPFTVLVESSTVETLRKGYGGEAFGKAMGGISEYYIQYHATVCCNDFDGSAYLMELASRVKDAVSLSGGDVPHLKLLAWGPEGDYGKADLIGVGRDIVLTKAFQKPCTEIYVMLNASAICPANELASIMGDAIDKASENHQLELIVFKQECFGMGG